MKRTINENLELIFDGEHDANELTKIAFRKIRAIEDTMEIMENGIYLKKDSGTIVHVKPSNLRTSFDFVDFNYLIEVTLDGKQAFLSHESYGKIWGYQRKDLKKNG